MLDGDDVTLCEGAVRMQGVLKHLTDGAADLRRGRGTEAQTSLA